MLKNKATARKAEEIAKAENLLDGKYECFYCGKGYDEPPEMCPKCLKSKYIEIIVV